MPAREHLDWVKWDGNSHPQCDSTIIPLAEVLHWIKRRKWAENKLSSFFFSYSWMEKHCDQLPYYASAIDNCIPLNCEPNQITSVSCFSWVFLSMPRGKELTNMAIKVVHTSFWTKYPSKEGGKWVHLQPSTTNNVGSWVNEGLKGKWDIKDASCFWSWSIWDGQHRRMRSLEGQDNKLSLVLHRIHFMV